MGTAEALNSLLALLTTIQNLQANANQVAALVQKAQMEGRTNFTPEEWAVIQGADNTARQQLVSAISAALLK